MKLTWHPFCFFCFSQFPPWRELSYSANTAFCWLKYPNGWIRVHFFVRLKLSNLSIWHTFAGCLSFHAFNAAVFRSHFKHKTIVVKLSSRDFRTRLYFRSTNKILTERICFFFRWRDFCRKIEITYLSVTSINSINENFQLCFV